MKRTSLLILCFFALAVAGAAQKLPTPKAVPSQLNEQQEQRVREGISLHDQKKYDEALVIYNALLKEDPALVTVIYEKSLTQYTMGDRDGAMETAYSGAAYLSDDLPMLYSIMANCLDDAGKPEEAIKLYKQAEDILKGDIGTRRYLSSVAFNLGVTYYRLKRTAEARAELKKAVSYDPRYESPHALLAGLFSEGGYNIPALFAAAGTIALKPGGEKARAVAPIVAAALKIPEKNAKGSIEVNLNLLSPSDEGNFAAVDVMLPLMLVRDDKKDADKTDSQMMAKALNSAVNIIAEDKKLSKTFVATAYMPMMKDLFAKGHGETLINVALLLAGDAKANAWANANREKVESFFQWSSGYKF